MYRSCLSLNFLNRSPSYDVATRNIFSRYFSKFALRWGCLYRDRKWHGRLF